MSNILELNKKPLKYLVTKNKNVITSPISESGGPLIVYEPQSVNEIDKDKEVYRELWVSKYFLASGFGAKSREEQLKLSDIADTFDNTYSYLNNQIANSFSYSQDLYNILDQNKVSKGTDENNLGDDISYNIFNFGGQNISLSELYDKFQNINILYKPEIYNVEYFVKFKNYDAEYPNFSNVPFNAQVKTITIIITGNTKDSGGIADVIVKLYNQNGDQTSFELNLENMEILSNKPNTSNTDYRFKFSKTFNDNEPYKFRIQDTSDLKNYIIKDIQITTYPLDPNSDSSSARGETITNIIDKFPSYFYSSKAIYVYSGLLNNKLIKNYRQFLLNDLYTLNITNDNIEHISILTNSNIRLISADYYDEKTNHIYDVIDFILTNYNYIDDNDTMYDVEYSINVDNETNNDAYESYINPPFLYRNQENGHLYLNKGKIVFTFIQSNDRNNPILKNTNQYWISYENDNIPLK